MNRVQPGQRENVRSPACDAEVDQLCDAFEEQWQAGQRPRIADYVSQLSEPVRTAVLRELVALDVHYRSRAGDAPTAADYVQMFPEVREWIGVLLADTTSVAGVMAPDTLVQSPTRESSDSPRSIAATQAVARADEQPDQPGSARPASADAAAPANTSFDKFAQVLTTSGLMDQAELDTFLANLPAERRPRDGKQLAQELFRGKRLTRFQVQAIYQGKTRGLVIGNYVVLDKLGQGGMGQVYTARHTRMDRIVAIKVLPAAATKSPEAVKRFQREVKAAAKLTHPNIVTAHDADEHRGVHFLVMECVAGKDLARLVREQGPFPIRQAVDVIVQAARGLEYAHRQGVIHRDIKPQNMLLDMQGVVKILDMGLARLEEQIGSRDDGLTHSGAVMGTLDYMAPEQAMDTKTADARADIYSLGCTLHYLLTGKAPYGGNSLAAKIVAHRMHPIPSLCEQRSDVPETLDAIFQKMVAKNPTERPQTMTELLTDLQTLVAQSELDSAPGSHAATVVSAGASVPTELLEEQDFVSLDGSAVELTERLLAPSLLLQCSGSRSRRRWDNKIFLMVLAVAGVVGIVALGGIIASLRTKDGTLVVEVDQPGAKVEVLDAEGKIVVTSASGEEPLVFTVPPGQHRVQIEKEGFKVYGEAVELETRGKTIIRARLEKALPAAPPKTVPAVATKVTQPSSPSSPHADTGWQLPAGAPPPARAPFDATQAKQHQDAWAKFLDVPGEMTNSIGMKLVLIPAGEFLMGSPATEAGRKSDEQQHPVRITRSFYLGVYEVTQEAYAQVMGVNPSSFKGPQSPVENVSWDDAMEFCRRLSESPTEKAAGRTYRLPTEAEWEYACRAGSTTRYAHGDDDGAMGDYAWFSGNASAATHPVGQKCPNAWGLYDMHGNVWEWCADWHGEDYYKSSPVDDPAGPITGSDRVDRGGSWVYPAPVGRSADRYRIQPSFRYDFLGFRVAAVPSASPASPASPASGAASGSR